MTATTREPCMDCGLFQCEECPGYIDHDACCCGRRVTYDDSWEDDADDDDTA